VNKHSQHPFAYSNGSSCHSDSSVLYRLSGSLIAYLCKESKSVAIQTDYGLDYRSSDSLPVLSQQRQQYAN